MQSAARAFGTWDEIPSAVRRAWRGSGSFPSTLERSFEDETWAERYREFRFWLWAFLAFAWITLGLTFAADPEESRLAVGLRLLVITPAYLAGIWALSRRQPRWLESAGCFLPHVVALLSAEAQFLATAAPDLVRGTIALTFGILATNLLVPLRPGQAIAYTAIALVGGDALTAVDMLVRHAPLDHPQLPLFGHMLVGLSLLGRMRAEARSRDNFLRGTMFRRQTDELFSPSERLLEIFTTDPLTGVATRRSYEKMLDRSWEAAAASGSALAVLMIDIDHFKSYNDRLGYLQGDECLRAVARAIVRQTRRGQDVVARFGGNEFVMLLPDTGQRIAGEVAERVRRAVANVAMPHPGVEGGVVTVSVGVAAAEYADPGGDADTLLAAADQALYAAKTDGRNRVRGHASANAAIHVPHHGCPVSRA
jgi:diguanylate cyclase (GGDEF)-like protein